MRITLNISFPDELYLYIRERSQSGAFASTSEYIRALVRDDRERTAGNGRSRRRPDPAVPRRVNEIMRDPD